MDFIGSDEEPKQMLMNIQNASMTANEVLLNITWRQEKIMTRLFTQYVNLQMRRG